MNLQGSGWGRTHRRCGALPFPTPAVRRCLALLGWAWAVGVSRITDFKCVGAGWWLAVELHARAGSWAAHHRMHLCTSAVAVRLARLTTQPCPLFSFAPGITCRMWWAARSWAPWWQLSTSFEPSSGWTWWCCSLLLLPWHRAWAARRPQMASARRLSRPHPCCTALAGHECTRTRSRSDRGAASLLRQLVAAGLCMPTPAAGLQVLGYLALLVVYAWPM